MLKIFFPCLGAILTNIFGLNILKSYISNRHKLQHEYNEILFYTIIFNALGWVLYGIIIKDIFIFLSGISTLVSSFGFIQIMYKYINQEKLIYIEILSLINLLYFIIIIFLLNFTHMKLYIIQKIVGSSCVFMTLCVNIVPLSIIKQVIRTQNTDLIYLPHAFINFTNYTCWFIYSLINYNIFLVITNSVSLLLCLFQIIVYSYVKSMKKKSSIILHIDSIMV